LRLWGFARYIDQISGRRTMAKLNLLYVNNRRDWRKWLEDNYKKEKEIWLVYYKKHTGKDRVAYEDAVEEALCFGWIDSIIRKLDEDRFAQKFTPRKNTSKWSESNKKRIHKLESSGLMSEAGLQKVKIAKETGKWDEVITPPNLLSMHADFEAALKKNTKATKNFNALAPSYKKQYIGWISVAKKAETRKKRIKEAIELLNMNQKLGLK
jgi:uncharacterized protein YdeI (YjbR/CyaY-like superfamily)